MTKASASNALGNIVFEQAKVNETGVSVLIADADKILKNASADQVRITGRMYYQNTVTQEVSKTISLKQSTTAYKMDFGNFGKFTVSSEYLKNGRTVAASNDVTIGIAAEEYNLAPVSATFPALLFSLSLWEGTDYCITRNEKGSPIPTIAVFQRADAWDWNSLPDNVYKLPTASEDDFAGNSGDGEKWQNIRYKMAAYIRDLYEISPNASFNLYYTDNFVENMLVLLTANRIPEDQYHIVLLSDGSGTYAIFKDTFKDDTDGSKYERMRSELKDLKERVSSEGKFDLTGANYMLASYAAVAAEEENVDWWVNRARITDTFKIENEELAKRVVGNCTEKSAAKMLEAIKEAGKTDDFKKLFHFDDNMFEKASEEGKKVMLILGTVVDSEQDFEAYARMAAEYYGDSYVYYYKGHPGTPTVLYPSKQQQLERLGITDIDSSIPAELILFFYPDIYMCGYDSTTFQSVQLPAMACGMFNMSKKDGLDKTYGHLMDFFTYRIGRDHLAYGNFCTEDGHAYYVLEFNAAAEQQFLIYDADTHKFITAAKQ